MAQSISPLQSIPPKVEYSLTDLGADAATQLRALIHLVQGNLAAVERAREAYDATRQNN